jgi:hypothetical protein
MTKLLAPASAPDASEISRKKAPTEWLGLFFATKITVAVLTMRRRYESCLQQNVSRRFLLY